MRPLSQDQVLGVGPDVWSWGRVLEGERDLDRGRGETGGEKACPAVLFSSTKLTERIDTRKTNQPSKQIPCVVPPESKKWGGGRIMVD